MHVPDIEAALLFFTDMLGFEVKFRMGKYAYVERDNVAFRVFEDSPEEWEPTRFRPFAYYIDVRDVDALYAELKPKLDLLPAGEVMGPLNQGYGQRELLVRAPDGRTLAFGQAIKEATRN